MGWQGGDNYYFLQKASIKYQMINLIKFLENFSEKELVYLIQS